MNVQEATQEAADMVPKDILILEPQNKSKYSISRVKAVRTPDRYLLDWHA